MINMKTLMTRKNLETLGKAAGLIGAGYVGKWVVDNRAKIARKVKTCFHEEKADGVEIDRDGNIIGHCKITDAEDEAE